MKPVIGQEEKSAYTAPKPLPRIQKPTTVETCHECGCMLNKINGHNSGIAYCKRCGLVSSSSSKGENDIQAMERVKALENENAICISDPNPKNHETISELWLSHSKASDQTEKNFALTLAEVTRIVQALSIESDLASRAAKVCRQAFEKGLSRGSSLSVLAAAAVYASSRLASFPITIEEVAAKSALPKSDLIHCFRKLQRKLGLTFVSPSPTAHGLRILKVFSIHRQGQLASVAFKILDAAEKNEVTQGRNPAAVAAAAIYAASLKVPNGHQRLTQRKLALVANVTETTIRRACQSLDP